MRTRCQVPRKSLLFFKESEDEIISISTVTEIKSRVWENDICQYQFILVKMKGTWGSPKPGSWFNK